MLGRILTYTRRINLRFAKGVVQILICLLLLSCNKYHESEIEQLIGTQFRDHYRVAALKQLPPGNNQILEDLEKINSDAFRSIAYTWQHAAISSCRKNSAHDNENVSRTSYQVLLDRQKDITSELYLADEVIYPCVVKFYSDHWTDIVSMIELHFKFRN